MNEALSAKFRKKCRNCKNMFGDGHASEKIIRIVKHFLNEEIILEKKFYDLR